MTASAALSPARHQLPLDVQQFPLHPALPAIHQGPPDVSTQSHLLPSWTVWPLGHPESAHRMEETGFVVGSGASVRMLSRRDFTSAELDTVRVSRHPATVITAHVSSAPNEEATHVRDCDSIVTVAASRRHSSGCNSRRKLCEDHGYSYAWKEGKHHILLKMAERYCANLTPTYLLLFLDC